MLKKKFILLIVCSFLGISSVFGLIAPKKPKGLQGAFEQNNHLEI